MRHDSDLARYVLHLRWEAAQLLALPLSEQPIHLAPIDEITTRLEALADAIVAEVADG